MAKVSAAFEQVFGGVNGAATIRDGKKEMRVGKTSRDKSKGHVAGKKNIREWVDGGRKGDGEWVKR